MDTTLMSTRWPEAEHRAEHDNTRIPILALTANALRGEAVRVRAAGMDEYLTKPLELHLLKDALTRWLPVKDDAQVEVPQAPGTAPVVLAIDPSVLEGLLGGDVDPTVVRAILAEYRATVKRLVVTMRAARDTDDLREAGAIAHKLKASSRAVGAVAMGDLCAELENVCRAGTRENLSRVFEQFEGALRALDAATF